MRFLLSTFMLACIPALVNAQQMTGTVISSDNNAPVDGVLVINKYSKEVAYTDSNGHYSIKAAMADTLLFCRIGYNPLRKRAHTNEMLSIMHPVDMALGEVAVVA